MNQPQSQGGLSRKQMRRLVFGLALGLFLGATEQSVVATALPTLAGEFGQSDRISWVVASYLIASTVVMPLYGKMSDLYGRKLVYLLAIASFGVGTVLCALAPSMNTLVLARAVQGLGGGGLLSLSFIIIGDVVSPRERGRYIGGFTAVFTAASITGPLWGGLLVDGAGWRWVFWAVVPLAVLAFVVSNQALSLPFARRHRPIDWWGIVLLVIAAVGLILVPIWGGHALPWTSWQLLSVLAVGLVATALFVWQEQRAEEPIVPMRLFGDRTVVAVMIMGCTVMGTTISISTILPLFLQTSLGLSATQAGLTMVPQSIAVTIAATVSGILVTRTGRYKWTLILGPCLAMVGIAALTTINSSSTQLVLAPIFFLIGLGYGLLFPNLTLSVQNAVPIQDLGIGTSTANFFRSVGAAFGSAIIGSLLASRLDAELASRLGGQELDDLGGAAGVIRTPALVRQLPPTQEIAAVESIANSVSSVLWVLVPGMAVVLVFGFMVRELPLRTSSLIGGEDGKPDGA